MTVSAVREQLWTEMSKRQPAAPGDPNGDPAASDDPEREFKKEYLKLKADGLKCTEEQYVRRRMLETNQTDYRQLQEAAAS